MISLHRLRICAVAILMSIATTAAAQNSDKIVLVSGATGTQGGAVARALLERGFSVRGLTRNPNSDAARELAALGVDMVRGDFDDTASLEAALEGAYGAYSVQQYRGIGVDAEIRQSKAFADAAKRAGVEHFVYSSVIYAHFDTGVPQFESKVEIEAYIRSIGLPSSFIRPASFMSNFEGVREQVGRGVYRTPFPADLERLHVAPQDIGRVIAIGVCEPGHVDRPRSQSRRTAHQLRRYRCDDVACRGAYRSLRADPVGRVRCKRDTDGAVARAMVHGQPRSRRFRCTQS